MSKPPRTRIAGLIFGTIIVAGALITTFSFFKKKQQEQLQEFSTNFDSEMVRPFLTLIQPLIESGFGSDQIEQVCKLVATLRHDQERTLEFRIRYDGQDATLRVRVFMDDINSPDIYFFSPPALSKRIESEFHRFAEERGI